MKNMHRSVKLEDSEENGVPNFSILLWPVVILDLLYIHHEYDVNFVCTGF
jgi:hypothetical protein